MVRTVWNNGIHEFLFEINFIHSIGPLSIKSVCLAVNMAQSIPHNGYKAT